MRVREIKNKKDWERFLLGCKEKTFLQSWNWGEFNRMMGEKIWRFGIYKRGQLGAILLVIKIVAKRGSFLFVPHGPVSQGNTADFKSQILNILLRELKEIAKQEKVDFVRIAPIWERTEENQRIFKNLGFREAPIHIHPEVTWALDISLPENEILMGMRKTTRNLIRRAKKERVEIFQESTLRGVEEFNRLYLSTVSRHHFVPFSLKYLRNEFLSFYPDNQIVVFFARHKNEILASAMLIYWQRVAFYHQGASIPSKIPAAYLLQWEAIREAKKRGCHLYNFWGIVPEIKTEEDLKDSNIRKHPWWGLSLFKIGFGGFRQEYLKTQDLILLPRYWLSFMIESIRRKKRGL